MKSSSPLVQSRNKVNSFSMAINKNILLKYEAATDDNTVYFIVVLSSL